MTSYSFEGLREMQRSSFFDRLRKEQAENVEWWDGQRDRVRARTEIMKGKP
jgi:hypothetical protein